MNFFSPTMQLKELLLLQHIEENPDTTQKKIANAIDGAASMVNTYMGKLEEENYLIRDYQSAKVVYYNITPQGIKRKNFLAITYFHELLELYRLAEENIEKFLVKLEEKGYREILVYGAGEVAETILTILKTRGKNSLKVIALIDDDEERQKTELVGYKIIGKKEIKEYKHDAIVITSYIFEEDIRKKLQEMNYPENKIEKFFTD